MDQTTAGEVLWVRAVETTSHPAWTVQDAAWASRSALQAVGSGAPADAFIAQRARAAWQRMAQRSPALVQWRSLTLARVPWLSIAMLLGLLAGVLVDRIGSGQRINLLAPPVWAVIAWNLVVYAGLLWRALGSQRRPQLIHRAAAALQQRWRESRLKSSGPGDGMAAVWAAFVPDWSRYVGPLLTARTALCLHAAAATLGLGVMGGMYLRGLVLDYRVGWESTFLNAETAQALLSTLLMPATALTGLVVPDVAGLRALQVPPAVPAAASTSTSAADWIHLYAAQLLLLVVLPRAALALWAGRHTRALSCHFPLPLDDPYVRRLCAEQRGEAHHINVWPYAHTPDAAAQEGLLAVFKQAFGADAQMRLAATVAFGAEDEAQPAPAAGEMVVALFDLSATPEPENHGRFVQRLGGATAAAVLMLVDQAGFARRFDAERQRQRRQAWQALADTLAVSAVFVDLQAPDLVAAQMALQRQGSA